MPTKQRALTARNGPAVHQCVGGDRTQEHPVRSPSDAMSESVPPIAAPAEQRALLEALLTAGIRAAHPDLCLPAHLPEPSPGRLIILAAGKAAGSMSAVASRFYRQQHGLGDDRIVGLAVARHGYGQDAPGIHMV